MPEGRTTCSGKCRAALSRQRRQAAREEQLREVREFLVRALARLEPECAGDVVSLAAEIREPPADGRIRRRTC
ncbi:MAG: hypothetical protein HY553_08415 [Elusimicrobia bacterium]|nr:hypothetical protein [Elusimicrobiota bacterium]